MDGELEVSSDEDFDETLDEEITKNPKKKAANGIDIVSYTY